MTRGLGGHSPANVTHSLKGVKFPATKHELIRHAKHEGASADVISVLEAFPEEKFQTMANVTKAYGEADKGHKFATPAK